jgi:RNA polymerase subunit RPABC4/transcription elongation factor Spt4
MRYSNYTVNPADASLSLTVECSKCHTRLHGEEKFCPECGKKIHRIPQNMEKKMLLTILNSETVGEMATPPANAEANANRPAKAVIEPGKAPDVEKNSAVAENKRDDTRCPWGKTAHEKCEFCSKNGACTRTVLTSCPPQYNICQFCGSGYMMCSEA